MPTVTYNMQELGSGRLFKVRGTGPSRSLAVTVANNKLKLITATILSHSVSDALLAGELGVSHPLGTQYSDAILVLQMTGTNITRTIRLDNIDTSYASSEFPGQLDITNADIIAFAESWFDGDGENGYVPKHGYFVG